MMTLFLIECRRYFKEMKMYSVNLILANIGIIIFFSGILNNVKMSAEKETTLIMMLIWYAGVHGFSNPAYIIEEEIADGTILQIVFSHISCYKILLLRSVCTILIDFLKSLLILFFLLIVLKEEIDLKVFLNFNILLIYISVLLTTYFIGFCIAGIAFFERHIISFANVVYYLVFFFSGFIIDIHNHLLIYVVDLLPFRKATSLINLIVTQGNTSWPQMLEIMVYTIFWWGLSFIIFNGLLKKSLKDGVITYE